MSARKRFFLADRSTKSSFSDLLLFENEAVPGVPIDDVEEVSNYVAAMQTWSPSHQGRLSPFVAPVRESHAILLRGGRGAKQNTG